MQGSKTQVLNNYIIHRIVINYQNRDPPPPITVQNTVHVLRHVLTTYRELNSNSRFGCTKWIKLYIHDIYSIRFSESHHIFNYTLWPVGFIEIVNPAFCAKIRDSHPVSELIHKPYRDDSVNHVTMATSHSLQIQHTSCTFISVHFCATSLGLLLATKNRLNLLFC